MKKVFNVAAVFIVALVLMLGNVTSVAASSEFIEESVIDLAEEETEAVDQETEEDAAAELVVETVVDYSGQLQTIISNQEAILVGLDDLNETKLSVLLEDLEVIVGYFLQVIDLEAYVSGFLLFIVICLLCWFIYKFFRIFF